MSRSWLLHENDNLTFVSGLGVKKITMISLFEKALYKIRGVFPTSGFSNVVMGLLFFR